MKSEPPKPSKDAKQVTVQSTEDDAWKKEVKECEDFVQEYDLSRGIQKMNINKIFSDSCKKCSYVYKREDIDLIEEDMFCGPGNTCTEQIPVHDMFDKILSSTAKPQILQFTKENTIQVKRSTRIARRPSTSGQRKGRNTPISPAPLPSKSIKRFFNPAGLDVEKSDSVKTPNKRFKSTPSM